jgi:RNA polymerase sigma factor (sigma-70 family)
VACYSIGCNGEQIVNANNFGELNGMSDDSRQLALLIEQLNAGDVSVRGELINIACANLHRLTSALRLEVAGFAVRLDTDQILQSAELRLYQSLHDLPIKDVRHFYQMAAVEIRRELIEVCHACGSQSAADQSMSPADLEQWAHFHQCVDELPSQQRDVFELLWYHELKQTDVAQLLKVSIKEVRRLWRDARLSLHDHLIIGHETN